MKRRLVRIAKFAFLTYGLLLVLLMLLERFMVYPAPPRHEGTWTASAFGVEDVDFESADGTRLHGWFLDRPNPSAHVLFCHGNGEHVGYLGDWLVALSEKLNVAIFAFDYRGYGKSDGKPFEQGLLEDGEAAQAWLARRGGVDIDEIVLYGRSLGGGVVVHLAGKNGARALVAERTFHSMVEIGAQQFPWAPVRAFMRNRYPSAERIASYSGPFLQVHGTADRIVPMESAKTLFESCPSSEKEFLEVFGMGHNDPSPAHFFDAFIQLIESTANQNGSPRGV